YLEHAADDPTSPIVFDTELNEYHFEYIGSCGQDECGQGKSYLMIYHCPFCGGTAPESKRGSLFAVIQPEEERRLYKLLGGIKSLKDAIQILGLPDDDNPCGVTMKGPESDGAAPTTQSFRTLRYSRLSETADLCITDYRSNGVHFSLQGKYIGPPTE